MERTDREQAHTAAWTCNMLSNSLLIAMADGNTLEAQRLATQLRHTTGDLVFFLKCVNEEKK